MFRTVCDASSRTLCFLFIDLSIENAKFMFNRPPLPEKHTSIFFLDLRLYFHIFPSSLSIFQIQISEHLNFWMFKYHVLKYKNLCSINSQWIKSCIPFTFPFFFFNETTIKYFGPVWAPLSWSNVLWSSN